MPDLFHPIKIAIDGNEANCLNRVGSNVYAWEILKALEKITRQSRKNFHLTVLLTQPPQIDLPKERLGFRYQIIKPAQMTTQIALPIYLYKHRREFDFFYTPGHYAPRFCPVPYISSVMDLAFLVYPQQFRLTDLFQLRSWTKYSVKNAAKIATISKFSRQEISKFYKRDLDDIILAYPAFSGEIIDLPVKNQKQILAQLKITQPFFLYLGTLQPRKNLLRLIEAFEIFAQKLEKTKNAPAVCLVLAGKTGWLTQEIKNRAKDSAYTQRIIFTGFVSNQQKATLLHKALATFNLGLYEGFGIPALESLAYKTIPVIADNSSLPEVIGNFGFKVDPKNTDKIAATMMRVAKLSQKQKEKLLQDSEAQIHKFNYEKSANQILTAFLRLYKHQHE